jgi:hypothetical protein
MGCSSSGRHLLEIGSLKDSRRRLFFFDEKRWLQKKAFACKKKRLTAKKSVCLQKKAFACTVRETS